MLSISGLHRFYYLRDFHDMRCKYERVRSIIRTQLNREPGAGEVYIMMSKDRRLVRLYKYDSRSCTLHEKKFNQGYKFMTLQSDEKGPSFSIDWKDVVALLESPVIQTFRVGKNML